MRVAFLNRGRDAFPGGDAIALDATMDALRKRGHVADEIGWVAEKLRDYDICHLMHSNFNWAFGGYKAILEAQKPYVLTPIYYPGPLLCGISLVDLTDTVRGAERLLPFSQKECSVIRGDILFSTPVTVLPNATDRQFHAPDGREHQSTLDVICVSARGDSDKNIPMLRRILGRVCGDNFTVATGLSRSDLADAYRRHRVFVNASESERMSLTIGEALCAGCRVLATDQNWGNSHYPGLVTFDPTDELHLEHLVRWVLTSKNWDYRPNAAARCLTWDWVAEKLETVYREVLNAI